MVSMVTAINTHIENDFNRSPLTKRALLQLGAGQGMACVSMVTHSGGAITTDFCLDKEGSAWIANTTRDTAVITDTSWEFFGACIDAKNGLHLAWADDNFDVWYAYYAQTNTGFTASPWAATATNKQRLFTYSSGNMHPVRIDMDTPGNTNHLHTVVGVYFNDASSSSTGSQYRLYVINDTTHAVSSTTQTLTTTKVVSHSPDIALACTKTGDATTNSTVQIVVAGCTSPTVGDTNDFVHTWNWVVSSSVFSRGPSVSIPSNGKGGGKRKYWLYCTENTNTFTLGGAGGTNFWLVYSFILTDPNTLTPRSDFSINTANKPNLMISQGSALYGTNFLPGVGTGGSDKLLFFSQTTNPYLVMVATIQPDGSITWYTTTQRFTERLDSASVGAIIGGTNRFYTTDTRSTVAVWYNGGTMSTPDGGLYYSALGSAHIVSDLWEADVIRPISIISTSYPEYKSAFRLPNDYSQVRMKMEWQVSADSSFTTIIADELQTDDFLTAPVNADAGYGSTYSVVLGALVMTTWTGITRVPQGAYYYRSRIVDEFGNVSAWGDSRQFTIAHAPTPTPLFPVDDDIIPFNLGQLSFSWLFSDPDPTDYQSAYEISITRTSDGVVVTDTGKVASSDNIGPVLVSATYGDTELQWFLTVWDSDDVASQIMGPSLFLPSVQPTPVVTAPADGSSVTTGRPTITVAPGISGTKTQASYRIRITQGVNTVYDTGVIADTNPPSLQLPSGILHNENDYTIHVIVTDSLGSEGFATSSFSTSYIPPAEVDSTVVFLYEFDRRGFVFVGWNWATRDTDFLSWNVYRQEIGGTDIVKLASFNEMRPVYGFRDYSAKANTRYQYWVTQAVNRSGDIVESGSTVVVQVTTTGEGYWLMDSLGIMDPVPLFNVTSDTWTDEHEESVYTVLGRGRHVDVGDTLGANGSLTIQARDRYVGLVAGSNWLSNPAMQLATDGINPDHWTFGTSDGSSCSQRYDSYIEPSPSGKAQIFMASVDALGNGQYFRVTSDLIDLTKTDLFGGGAIANLSTWVAIVPGQALYQDVSAVVNFYAADGTTQVGAADQLVPMSMIDTYEPSGSGDADGGNWQRYGGQIVVPASAYNMKVEFRYNNSTGSTQAGSFYFGGNQVNSGLSAIPYVDGDIYGGYWNSGIGLGSSTTGYFTAHQQRIVIEKIKELNRPLYLRNPFGEVLYISIGDEGNSRIGGVGTADFNDITLPYREVAF